MINLLKVGVNMKVYIGQEVNVNETNTSETSVEIKAETIENVDKKIVIENFNRIPKTDGIWTGEPGDSEWIPDLERVPGNTTTNPEGKIWGEILEKYDIESIPFKDGEPDFSEICQGEVEIDDFTDNRADNFSQADEKLAEQLGKSPEEIAKFRADNKYTWHECKDCKTMQLVPTEVHGNVPHSGGISEYKKQNKN